jgi:hypothetical protein
MILARSITATAALLCEPRVCPDAPLMRSKGRQSGRKASPALFSKRLPPTMSPAMKSSHALSLLIILALLTPVLAMFGLYETSLDELARFAGPAIGAISAIAVTRILRRPAP